MAPLTNNDLAALRDAGRITFKQDGDAAHIVCDGVTMPQPLRRAVEFYGERADGVRSIRVRSNSAAPLALVTNGTDPALRTALESLHPGDDLMLLWTTAGTVTTLRLVVCRWPDETEVKAFVIGYVVVDVPADDSSASSEGADAASSASPKAPGTVRESSPKAVDSSPTDTKRRADRNRRWAKASAGVAGAVVAVLLSANPFTGGLLAIALFQQVQLSPRVLHWLSTASKAVKAARAAKPTSTATTTASETQRMPLRPAA